MPINIPFGAVDGITAQSEEIDVSFGKLYSGGTSLYLFVQNKIKRTSLSKTTYASCANWIVIGVTQDGSINNPATPEASTFPVDQMSAGYQEEPNIIWKALNPGGTPDEITPGSDPNTIAPATIVDCIQIIGYNGNFQITVKGPDGILDNFDPATFLSGVGISNIPDMTAWNRGWTKQMNRTDWQTFTRTGKGYNVGGDLETYYQGITGDSGGGSGSRKVYYAVNYTVNARGDVTETGTKFEILEA